MKVVTKQLELETRGAGDLIDITVKIQRNLEEAGLQRGNVTVFVVGSTAGITTFEYESGLITDMQEMYNSIIPQGRHYAHDETWGDANGFSHLRAALQGPSLTVPFENGKLILGTWQQIVLAEFDNRPRDRQVVLQMIGE